MQANDIVQADARAITAPPQSQSSQIMEMIQFGLANKIDPDGLSKLNDLLERINDREGRAEMARDFAKFKSICPFIPKQAKAKVSGDGGSYTFTYAKLPAILKICEPILERCNMAHSFDSEEVAPNKHKVTCTLEHVNGQKKSSSTTITSESKAGCSPQQKISAAIEFGKRLSFSLVCGIQTVDSDFMVEDTPAGSTEAISEDQFRTINDLCIECGTQTAKGVCDWQKVEKLSEILASSYPQVVDMIKRKIAAKKAGAA